MLKSVRRVVFARQLKGAEPPTTPLERRVVYVTALFVTAALAVSAFLAYGVTRTALYREIDATLVGVAVQAASTLPDDPAQWKSSTGSNTTLGYFSTAVLRSDGSVEVLSGRSVNLVPTAREIAIASGGQGSSVRTLTAPGGRPYRTTVVAVRQSPGSAFVVSRPFTATQSVLRSLAIALLIMGIVGIGFAVLAGVLVSRISLAPLHLLADAFQRVTHTDELHPIDSDQNGDMARITESFNQMLGSLRASRQRQNQLIADAGHELRTPLTSLRTNIDLLTIDQDLNRLEPEDRKQILKDVAGQALEFSQLITDLVQLAREDSVKLKPEPVLLSDVVEASLARVRLRAATTTFDVHLEPSWTMGDASDLERAFTNLLDNAAKYSPDDGVVTVVLADHHLRVSDTGPGINEEDLPFLFDRFYRAEKHRSVQGAGLGLAIVSQTIERHGGWVKAGNRPSGGAVFTAFLPPCPAPGRTAPPAEGDVHAGEPADDGETMAHDRHDVRSSMSV